MAIKPRWPYYPSLPYLYLTLNVMCDYLCQIHSDCDDQVVRLKQDKQDIFHFFHHIYLCTEYLQVMQCYNVQPQ